jgi:hypothetical protein
MVRCKQFLDYAAAHQDAVLTYKRSNIVLVVHSDASYLREPKAQSRAGGHFFLSLDTEDPINNGAVLNLAQLIKAVMSSAVEAELGALYINAREAIPQCQTLAETGHKQPPNPMQTDNSTALGVVNKTTYSPNTQKPWACNSTGLDAARPNASSVFSGTQEPPTEHYWTKHHCAAHHIEKRPKILTSKIVLDPLRASVKHTPEIKPTAQPT